MDRGAATADRAFRGSDRSCETFRGVGSEGARVYGSRIASGLAAVLAGMAVLFAALAVVYNPVFLFVAAVFGLSAYFVWYHASGRLARRLYRGVEARADPGPSAGFGAGPREDWAPPRDGPNVGGRVGARGRGGRAGPGRGRGTAARRRPPPSDVPTAREAYDALGLEPDADQQAVREAYRRRVKEVHPDRPGGDEEAFKEVTAAYERLTD